MSLFTHIGGLPRSSLGLRGVEAAVALLASFQSFRTNYDELEQHHRTMSMYEIGRRLSTSGAKAARRLSGLVRPRSDASDRSSDSRGQPQPQCPQPQCPQPRLGSPKIRTEQWKDSESPSARDAPDHHVLFPSTMVAGVSVSVTNPMIARQGAKAVAMPARPGDDAHPPAKAKTLRSAPPDHPSASPANRLFPRTDDDDADRRHGQPQPGTTHKSPGLALFREASSDTCGGEADAAPNAAFV